MPNKDTYILMLVTSIHSEKSPARPMLFYSTNITGINFECSL